MSRVFRLEPWYVTEDAPEPEPDECIDCGKPTRGTNVCDEHAATRFENPVNDDLPEEDDAWRKFVGSPA